MTTKSSPHVVPITEAEKLRQDGFTWPRIAQMLWMRTGQDFQHDSIKKAVYRAQVARLTSD